MAPVPCADAVPTSYRPRSFPTMPPGSIYQHPHVTAGAALAALAARQVPSDMTNPHNMPVHLDYVVLADFIDFVAVDFAALLFGNLANAATSASEHVPPPTHHPPTSLSLPAPLSTANAAVLQILTENRLLLSY